MHLHAQLDEACYMCNRTRCHTMKLVSRMYRQEQYLLLHQRLMSNQYHGSQKIQLSHLCKKESLKCHRFQS